MVTSYPSLPGRYRLLTTTSGSDMHSRGYIHFMVVSVVAVTGCKKNYSPSVAASDISYLVVEGVINSGQDSTIIKLSRTVKISGSVASRPELDAVVTIISDANASYPLQEIGGGKYVVNDLNLETTHKYYLDIKTTSGKEYASDSEPLRPNPPIDSVGYIVNADGIQLYVNTHDPKNNTHYYRWEYTETWKFNTAYVSPYVSDGTKIVYRKPDQYVSTCFESDTSSTTLVGSTANLSLDQVYQSPLTKISSTSEKIESRYSMRVKQYAITGKEYNFWNNLKKNTEQIGTIFDAQPSEIQGNVHCVTNPAEPVIGYVSVTNVQQKRIFIDNSALPQSWRAIYPYQCSLDTLLYRRPSGQNDVALFLIPIPPTQLAVDPIDYEGFALGFLATDPPCADCTVRGGTTKQPDFWR